MVMMLLAGDAFADGREIVENNCLGCHDAQILEQQRINAKQWAAVVKRMVGWGAQVEPENVDALVAYLASRATGKWTPAEVDAAQMEARFAPQPDGKFARGSVAAGRTLYRKACAPCHGSDGQGTATGMNLADRPGLWRAAEFAAVVRGGRARMPKFPLGDRPIASLLAFLRSL